MKITSSNCTHFSFSRSYFYVCSCLFLQIVLQAQPDTLDWADFDVPEVGHLQWIEANHVFDFEPADVDRDGREEAVVLRSDPDYPLQMAAREIQNGSYTLLPRPAHITWIPAVT